MRLVESACAWLLHIALVRGRTRSRETWRTYAEALYDWWQTLETMDWTRDAVSPLHVAAYVSTTHWVKPEIVVEVQYVEWTSDGHLRHPSLLGIRKDKRAKDVVRE